MGPGPKVIVLTDVGAGPKKRGKGRKGKKKKGEDDEEEKPDSDDDVWRQYGSDEELDAPYLPPVRLQPARPENTCICVENFPLVVASKVYSITKAVYETVDTIFVCVLFAAGHYICGGCS